MIEPLFNNFATAAFFEFIVFGVFEIRFLTVIWRARRAGQLDALQVQLAPRNACACKVARGWTYRL